MQNSVNIQVINGRWTINGKPLNQCSIAKKNFFASYVKMRLVKSEIHETHQAAVTRKDKFRKIVDNFLNNEPNINNLTFERYETTNK